jgi:hypothetical protein
MRKKFLYFIVLIPCFLTALKSDNLPALFVQRLARAQIIFIRPENYVDTPLVKNGQMHYEYALKYPGKNFEVRYAVMPLDSVFIQFEAMQKDQKSVGTVLNPNKLYEGSFYAVMMNISNRGRQPKIQAFPADAAKKEFNADWAGFGLCEAGGEFASGYKYCMAVAIHKDNLGDAYYFYLSNDAADFQTLLPPIFYAMKFK